MLYLFAVTFDTEQVFFLKLWQKGVTEKKKEAFRREDRYFNM